MRFIHVQPTNRSAMYIVSFPKFSMTVVYALLESKGDAEVIVQWLKDCREDWYVICTNAESKYVRPDAFWDGVCTDTFEDAVAEVAYKHALRCLNETGLGETYWVSDLAYEISNLVEPHVEEYHP